MIQKRLAALGYFQPFRADTVVLAEVGEQPERPSLYPYAFVCGIRVARPVQARKVSAIFPVKCVLCPK